MTFDWIGFSPFDIQGLQVSFVRFLKGDFVIVGEGLGIEKILCFGFGILFEVLSSLVLKLVSAFGDVGDRIGVGMGDAAVFEVDFAAVIVKLVIVHDKIIDLDLIIF